MTEFRQALDALERIRALCGSTDELSLPQICVVGDQSSGKSTLLGSLVPGLDEVLPQGSGTCTVAPIVVRLCRGEPHKIDVDNRSFDWDKDGRAAAQTCLRQRQAALDFRVSKDAFVDIIDSNDGAGTTCDIPAVTICVTHPEVTDLTVVDLPGIVQIGEGRQRVENMIRHYISSPDCLIVVVKPANDDFETASAARFASEADPLGKRTLSVLTKCDVFSETANKTRVVEEVRRGANDPRGPHAVCCRKKVDGDEAPWTADAEDDWFRSDPDFAELKHIGSKSLAGDRLPTLLSQLIKSNVPRLRAQIHSHIAAAAAELRQLGELQPEKSEIRRELQSHLRARQRDLQCDLTTILRSLREALEVHKERVQPEWVSNNCNFNAFDAIFFQGKDAFNACIQEIAMTWWREDVDRSVIEALVVVRRHTLILESFPQVTDQLRRAFSRIWEGAHASMDADLHEKAHAELSRASKYGTLKNCWDASFFESENASMEVLQGLRAVVAGMSDEWLHQDTVIPEIDNFIAQLEKATDIVSRQESCVFRAVQSYYSVMFDQTVDNLVSLLRDNILGPWEAFVDNTLASDVSIVDACGEEATRVRRRQFALDLRQRMIACEERLNEVF